MKSQTTLRKAMSRHLTVRLEDAQLAALAAAAERDRRPVGSLVRNVLSDWLVENRTDARTEERAA